VLMKETLAQRWGIGLNAAHRTLTATTQRGVHTIIHPLEQRVPTSRPYLDYPVLRNKKMYTDTLFAKIKSQNQNHCAQVWTDGLEYTLFYPLTSKKLASTTVCKMVQDMNAIPEIIVSDGAPEERFGDFKKEVGRIQAKRHLSEPYSPWQN